jgi:mono/diheme cytochrome c family protein
MSPFAVLSAIATAGTVCFLLAEPPADNPKALQASFEQQVKPFFQKNCVSCHNAELMTSGVRVDNLDGTLEDSHLKMWEHIRGRIKGQSMPPKGMPQPTLAERQQVVDWITQALEVARLRPSPKNGLVRRLTVAQYRNTLRELLQLDDDLTEALPADAVSKDGFVNNKETLQMSPLLTEAYFEIAEEALNRSIVDVKAKPKIENFRMELGANVNRNPYPEELILGANSMLLDNRDFEVTEITPRKPFLFEPVRMRTKFRFIEGYQGNDTVRGWREYDSIYHAVFACVRGSKGYPKGNPYDLVPEGLLLRPAIPNDEMFMSDGTYGPKANFKISLRQLPDYGRFRVTVLAAKYDDGLLLDAGAAARAGSGADAVVCRDLKAPQEVTIRKSGVYQVDVYPSTRPFVPPAADSSRLEEGLTGTWGFDGGARVEGNAPVVDSPFGKALSLTKDAGALSIPRNETPNLVSGDFTVSAWIRPRQLQKAGIIAFGDHGAHGWSMDLPDDKGVLHFGTAGPDSQSTGAAISAPGTIRANAWQHVAAVVRRGERDIRLYVDGYPVARADIGLVDLDGPKAQIHIGTYRGNTFEGELDEIRLYRRALEEREIQALVQPGRQFVEPPPPEKPREVKLTLGSRQFAGALLQPAFLAVRLNAGRLRLSARHTGVTELDRVVLTPLAEDDEVSRRFLAFEKRLPRVGVHLGLRRDCGSSLVPAGAPQTVPGTKLTRFVFEGAIRNFPSPDVEKDNVNYLAGVREIGVRSEYTDGRDMPRLLVRSIEFEGPLYEMWPPRTHRNIFVDFPHKEDQAAYARHIVRTFATRAYRRPVTPAEESTLMAVYEKSFASGRGFQESVKDALLVVLTSPQFLFLIENSRSPDPEPLDNYELASKLSYFLWNGPPDRTTLQLASRGTLRKGLDSEVDRMIADPRFSRFTHEFVSQWLNLDKFQVLEPDRKRYPKLTRDTRAQLREEPVEFVEYLIRNNLPVRDLIQSDFLLANETVASYYGLGDKTEDGFRFLPIHHGRPELGGVLTEAAILAGQSDGRESNPVKRGAWLARKIIAEPPPPPPPNVPALKDDPSEKLTLRQRIERHRSQPGCQQCHSTIDPWGIALEEFDAGGRLKQEPIDAHSRLPDGAEVSGASDLKRHLAEDRIDQVAFSVLKHLATYATGRTLTYNEVNSLKQDGLKLKPGGYRMKDMVRFVVNSNLFLEK